MPGGGVADHDEDVGQPVDDVALRDVEDDEEHHEEPHERGHAHLHTLAVAASREEYLPSTEKLRKRFKFFPSFEPIEMVQQIHGAKEVHTRAAFRPEKYFLLGGTTKATLEDK